MSYSIIGSDISIEGQTYSGATGALAIHPDGRPYHTFRTATVLVDGDRVSFKNCRFENTAGPGKEAGQAIALYLDGDDITLEDCILTGHQDTLFLAPLPPKAVQKDGFLGPKQFTPRTPRTYYFKKCRIEGGVDFICGGAGSVSAWLSSESLLLAQEKKIAVKRMKLRVWRINFLFTATPDF